jgi:hypothetical protein
MIKDEHINTVGQSRVLGRSSTWKAWRFETEATGGSLEGFADFVSY